MIPKIKQLRKQLQPKHHFYFLGKKRGKGGNYRPILDYFFVIGYLRTFSIYFTRLAISTSLSANQVTFTTILLGVVSSVLLAFNVHLYSIIAVLILQLIHILDCTDGEVARYKKQSSQAGDYLDIMQHWITETLVFLAIGYGLFLKFQRPELILLGGLIAISFLLRELYLMSSTFIYVERRYMGNPDDVTIKTAGKSATKSTINVLRSIYSFVDFMFSFYGISVVLLIFATLDFLIAPFLFYGTFLPLSVIAGLYQEFYRGYDRGRTKLRKIKNKIN